MATNKASQVITGVARQTLCAVIPAKAGIFLALGILILAACGGDSTSGGNASAESDLMVSTYDDLPVCSDAREGVMAYVKDKRVAYVCVEGDWTIEEGSSSLEDGQAGAVKNKSISGVSQKGPFLKGTIITAYELDGSKSLLQTGRTFSGSITQDDGRFNLSNVTLKSSYVRLSANGYYRNEVTGKNSTSPITLNAVTDLSSRNTVNVNLLTHLEYGRVSHLMGAGDGTLKIKQVKKQAEKEIFDAFHIDATGFGYSEDLDVFGKTEADAALLAISILLQGDRTESELTALLAELSDDLSDGKWDDAEKRAAVAGWALEKELSGEIVDYRSYVEGWGLSTIVPDFEKYVHQFWNEEVGKCNDINEGELAEVPYRNVLFMVKCENGVWNTHALKDSRDGQDYRAIKIGDQVWMAENLNYETANSYCYKDSASYCTKYGRLYTWAAAMDSVGTLSTNGKGCGYGTTCSPTYPVRGVCPEGWHLPTEEEFETLFTAVGGKSIAARKLKSATGWAAKIGITNEDAFAFSALPAGNWNGYGIYIYEGDYADFWSSTAYNSSSANHMILYYNYDYANLGSNGKYYGFSVRCLKD